MKSHTLKMITVTAVLWAGLLTVLGGKLYAAAATDQGTGGSLQQGTNERMYGFSFVVLEPNGQVSYVKGREASFVSQGILNIVGVSAFLYQNGVCSIELFTPQAVVDLNKGLVSSESEVEIRKKSGITIKGVGLLWDTNQKYFNVLNKVNSLIGVQDHDLKPAS